MHDDWIALAGEPQVIPVDDPITMVYAGNEQHVSAPDANGAMHHWWWTASTGALRQNSWD